MNYMKSVAIKTPIIQAGADIEQVLIDNLPPLAERTVVVIASKLLSTCQNRFVSLDVDKTMLVRQEADRYLDESYSQFSLMFTIKNGILTVDAGIDQSNSNGQYILWPHSLQETCNQVWSFLRTTFKLNQLGLVVTDSKLYPLRTGVTARAIAHCGFEAIINKIGTPDLFGQMMKMTSINVSEAIAVATQYVMGETNESQPIGLCTDIPHIVFQDRVPSQTELDSLIFAPEDDFFLPFFRQVSWKQGGGGYHEN